MYYEVHTYLAEGYIWDPQLGGPRGKPTQEAQPMREDLDLPSLSNLHSTVGDNEGLSVSMWAILTLYLLVSASTNSVGSPILCPFDSWLNCVDFD